MKTLYIDMDGVVADFNKAIEEFHPDVFSNDFDYNEKERIVDSICKEYPHIFHTLPPIENSIETVHRLFPHFNVYFLSTPMWEIPQSFMGKRVWIEKYFGDKAKKRLILTHRKDLNIGDYLIDDRIANGVENFTGEHIHFGTEKFPDWQSVYNYLTKN